MRSSTTPLVHPNPTCSVCRKPAGDHQGMREQASGYKSHRQRLTWGVYSPPAPTAPLRSAFSFSCICPVDSHASYALPSQPPANLQLTYMACAVCVSCHRPLTCRFHLPINSDANSVSLQHCRHKKYSSMSADACSLVALTAEPPGHPGGYLTLPAPPLSCAAEVASSWVRPIVHRCL
jgi:hypothetical protein